MSRAVITMSHVTKPWSNAVIGSLGHGSVVSRASEMLLY